MREKRVENVSGQRRAYALRDFLVSGINFSPPRGAATVGGSKCVSRRRLNASDLKMILVETIQKNRGDIKRKIVAKYSLRYSRIANIKRP
jgi:hypothetical protein